MKLDLNNLYGAWFNMTQQKATVNLALKYTHEMRPESYESLNHLKLHYFPRHKGHSRKINSSSFTSKMSISENL